jgi:hypothetical protein
MGGATSYCQIDWNSAVAGYCNINQPLRVAGAIVSTSTLTAVGASLTGNLAMGSNSITGANTGTFSGLVTTGGIAATAYSNPSSGRSTFGYDGGTNTYITSYPSNGLFQVLNNAGAQLGPVQAASFYATGSGGPYGATYSSGDLAASRSTTTGAIVLGGSGSQVTGDYNVSLSGAVTWSKPLATQTYYVGNATLLNPGSGYMTLGYNQSTPAAAIDAYAAGCTFTFYNNNGAGFMPVTGGAYTNASDISFKQNISPISYGLDTVMALKPSSFDFKPEYGGGHKIGFIAQDVQPIIPEIVSEDPNTHTLGVDYAAVTSVLARAIQELKGQFDAYVASHP